MPQKKRRNQRRLPRGQYREGLSAGVIGATKRRIEQEARRFNVSKSFVIAVALAHVFKIKEQEDYD